MSPVVRNESAHQLRQAVTLQVLQLGSQIVKARLGNGLDVLYLSPYASRATPARGGSPVLFPQFANLGSLPKHGFARTSEWRLVNEYREDNRHCVLHTLNVQPGQHANWPHTARLELHIELAPEKLVLRLVVTNTGNTSFSWTGGLHPYFSVKDLEACSVQGLSGVRIQDRYDKSLVVESEDTPRWGKQPFERLYAEAPPLILDTGHQKLKLSAIGFDQWMVWSPGEADGNALPDLPEGDWRRFICLEPVRIARPVEMTPGTQFAGSLSVQTVLTAPESPRYS